MIQSGVCPEILTFKEEINKDKEIFNASKYFKEETMLVSKDDMEKSMMNINFFMDSLSFPEEYILENDLKEYNLEAEPIVDYENNNIIINEESNFNQINEESNMIGNVKYK